LDLRKEIDMQVDIDFNVTDSAQKEIKKAMSESELNDHLVRVSVQGGGCSGFMYGLGFVEKSDVDDKADTVHKIGEVDLVIDNKSLLFLNGVTLDWIDDLSQRGFKFNNPNATKSCGCGKSFQ
jgi:iron-sulfur cluster assembly accessory protein